MPKELWKDRYKLLLALPHDLAEQLRALAKKENRTLTGQIIHMLQNTTETTNEPIKHVRHRS